MIRGLVSGMISGLISPLINIVRRWAYNFDGVDDRGQLAFRAINPEGDNTFEFWTPAASKVLGVIIAQNATSTFANREFQLWTDASGTILRLLLGGVTNQLGAVTPATRYRLELTGNTFTLKDARGSVIRSGALTKGTAREPSALTTIGANVDSGFTNFFQGPQYNVSINGTLYPMGDRNQAIQLPSPSGLGPELITQSVLENPFVKGSQWSYLGDGRWQLVGNGDLNELIFVAANLQPEAGFLEFEIESITGTLMCTQSSATNLNEFSTPGVKRYFYTQKALAGVSGSQTVIFKRRSGSVNCIIKNISFKPLWVASAAELVTNGDFSSSAGWSLGPNSSISGGVLQVTNTTGTNNNARTVATVNTKAYQLTYRVTAITSGAVRALVYGNGVHYIGPDRTAVGTYTELVIFNQPAGSAVNTINIQAGHTGATTCTVDDVSLRELDSLCNPLTLVNTASTGWQEIQP